jgi:tRNA nucleotidyltransferase (CCA-adding enzyme)
LMEKKPSRMFTALRECGALAKLLPELDQLYGVPQSAVHHPEIDTGIHVMMVVDHAAARGYALAVRFAALVHDLGKGTTPVDAWPHHRGHEARSVELLKEVCARLKVPSACRELAVLVAREHGIIHQTLNLSADALVQLLERNDALRKPARFAQVLQACEADSCGRLGFEGQPYVQADRLREALIAARGVDAGAIAEQHLDAPMEIKAALHNARLAAVAAILRV